MRKTKIGNPDSTHASNVLEAADRFNAGPYRTPAPVLQNPSVHLATCSYGVLDSPPLCGATLAGTRAVQVVGDHSTACAACLGISLKEKSAYPKTYTGVI